MVTKAKETHEKKQEVACKDKNCPMHGGVKVRGRTFVGTVTSDRMSKTVVVSWQRRHFVKKFERYERRFSKMSAHNPECLNAKKGDVVKIVETRPLSKTKHFTVTEIIGKATKKEHLKVEAIEDGDVREELARKKDTKKESKSDDE